MAKVSIKAGTTSYIADIFIQDSSSTTGAGKTGLAFNTASLTAYYVRPGAAAASITLATQTTTGAYSSGGFVEIDATNMPGWYRFDIPDACLAAGAKSVGIHLKGATNMAPLPLEIELTGTDNQDAVRGGMTALPNANAEAAGGLYTRGTGAGQIAQDANGNVRVNLDTIKTQAVTCAAGVTMLASVGTAATSTAQTGDCFARLGVPAGASHAADIAAIKAETAAIVADTNELQTDWVDGGRLDLILDARASQASVDAVDDLLDTEVAAIFNRIGAPAGASIAADVAAVKAETATIVTDTNELQTDLTNGGRLDLLIDAIKARTDNLPSGVKKNTELANFKFLMVDSADHVTPKTGVAVTATRSLDGAAFGACANAVAEVGNGVYKITLAAADLNADVVCLKFTAAGADQRTITIKTNP